MARPVGQFARRRDECFEIITQISGNGMCEATNAFLARRLGVTTRQINKYIADLKKTGKLEVRTSPLRKDMTTGAVYKKRYMRPVVKTQAVIQVTLPTTANVGVDLTALAKLAQIVKQEEEQKAFNYALAHSEETNGNISP